MNGQLYLDDMFEHKSLIDVLKLTIFTLFERRREDADNNEEICKLRSLLKDIDLHISGLNKRIDSLTDSYNITRKQLEEMTTDKNNYAVLANSMFSDIDFKIKFSDTDFSEDEGLDKEIIVLPIPVFKEK